MEVCLARLAYHVLLDLVEASHFVEIQVKLGLDDVKVRLLNLNFFKKAIDLGVFLLQKTNHLSYLEVKLLIDAFNFVSVLFSLAVFLFDQLANILLHAFFLLLKAFPLGHESIIFLK